MPTKPVEQLHRALLFSEQQVRSLIHRHPDLFPTTTSSGRWDNPGELWTDWCGGFLAGMMWLFFDRTKDPWWRQQAEHYSRLLEHRKTDRAVHDLGFIFLNTYRRWYDASADDRHMDVVVQAARTLAKRFQEKGQYIASFLGPQSLFVDIMMNVPLLVVAADWLDLHPTSTPTRLSTDASARDTLATAAELRRIATAHCVTSQKYLVRQDGSTSHEAIFDLNTGRFLHQSTQQGLRSDSCWSRGLAWALYGFGTVYRLTRNPQFLDTACRCADYFIGHLPTERVPTWDFDLPPSPERLWDSSAAAIAASGLLQLDMLTSGEQIAPNRYRVAALEMLDVLCSDEFLAISTPLWEGILRHGVYHFHKKLGVDESVMWGDHFFVEALVKALALLEAKRV